MTASKLRIDIRGLEKSFGEERVLKGLDLSLSSGNFYCLMAVDVHETQVHLSLVAAH